MSAWGGAFYACIRLGHPRQETAVATREQPVVMSRCRGSRTWSRVRRSLFTRIPVVQLQRIRHRPQRLQLFMGASQGLRIISIAKALDAFQRGDQMISQYFGATLLAG